MWALDLAFNMLSPVTPTVRVPPGHMLGTRNQRDTRGLSVPGLR